MGGTATSATVASLLRPSRAHATIAAPASGLRARTDRAAAVWAGTAITGTATNARNHKFASFWLVWKARDMPCADTLCRLGLGTLRMHSQLDDLLEKVVQRIVLAFGTYHILREENIDGSTERCMRC